MSTISIQTDLVLEECYKCNCLFAMPRYLNNQARSEGRRFWCPNGHDQVFTKSKVKELEEKLSSTESKLANKEWQLAIESNHHKATRATLTRVKNNLRKVETRVAHGVCPCCNRTFKQLQAHMKTQHPEYIKENSNI